MFDRSGKESLMKKLKRILALLGALILILLYVSTLVFALMDHPVAGDLLKASIACTILLPVLLYAFILVHRLTGRRDGK